MDKGKLKTIIIVLILFLTGIALVLGINFVRNYLSGAAGGEEPKNVRVQADASSATITWQSEKESIGVIEYGTSQANLLLRAVESQATTVHRVVLTPLKENTTYYFRIRVGESIYDNNGIPYTFRTKSKQLLSPTPSPALSPTPTATVSAATPTPTVLSPTPKAGTSGLVSECVEEEFKEKFGSSDASYDFNGDGVVTAVDLMMCLNQKK